MPDLGELLLLLVLGAGAAAVIATPFVRSRRAATKPPAGRAAAGDGQGMPEAVASEDLEVLRIRHRVALEAIRDVEADRGAGSLDDAAYAEQRELAERRAEETLAELLAAGSAGSSGERSPSHPGARRPGVPGRRVLLAGGVLAAAAIVGLVLPAPFSLANPVRFNKPLADQLQQEAARQQTIKDEIAKLNQDPTDTAALSKLADAYLGGSSSTDIANGAQALLALLSLDPKNTSAYQRLITAYIQVADWIDASAATESYAGIAPDSPDIPFFRGVIALQGTHDNATAIRQFNAFLAAAPDDPRVTMVTQLLREAQAAPGASAFGSPSASPLPPSSPAP